MRMIFNRGVLQFLNGAAIVANKSQLDEATDRHGAMRGASRLYKTSTKVTKHPIYAAAR